MSSKDRASNPQAPTCESCDEEEQEPFPYLAESANIPLQKSKPELAPSRSYERQRKSGSDSGYSSRTGATSDSKEFKRKDKRLAPLRIDTEPSIQERERRPYASIEARPLPPQRSSSRPITQRTESTASKQEHPHQDYKHRAGECWICDKYGKHVDLPPLREELELHATSVPSSPVEARRQPPQVPCPESTPRPRPRDRGSSYRSDRSSSYFPSMTLATSYHAVTPEQSQPYGYSYTQPIAPTYAAPLTPLMTPYSPITYSHTPVIASPQCTYPPDPQPQCYQPPPVPQSPQVEADRRGSMHDYHRRPIIQQPPSEASTLPDRRTTLRHEDQHTRSREHSTASRSHKTNSDEDYDRRTMPPPPRRVEPQVVLAHRPSIRKTATTISTPRLTSRPPQYHGNEYIPDDRAQVSERPPLPRDLRSEPPPSMFRGPRGGDRERSPSMKKPSYDYPNYSTEIPKPRSSSPAPPMVRRSTVATAERHEIEAETYQRHLGIGSALTDDALRRLSKHTPAPSTTSSSQRSRNSSSKGSSGTKKTGRSASEGINFTINGMMVGISGEDAQKHTLNITTEKDGAVNISLGGNRGERDEPVAKGVQRTPSITSRASKSSRGTRGSEVGGDRDRDRDRDRNSRHARDDAVTDRASRRSSRFGLSSLGGRQASRSDHDYFVFGT